MRAVTTYTPTEGNTEQITLQLQTGLTEVINDSNFLLVIQTNTGNCYQVPGQVALYPTPGQGGTFAIQALPQVAYLFSDLGISNNITVNQFLDGEISGISYPYFITRSVNLSTNTGQQINVPVSVAALSSGISASLVWTEPGRTSGYVYLTALDLSIDQETTAHGFTLQISPLGGINGNQTFVYDGHTMTTQSFQMNLRWVNNPLVATVQGNQSTITASIAVVSGSTARASLNLSGYFQ